MVVLIDEDRHIAPSRRFRQAPPIAHDVRGKKEGGRNKLDDYDDMDFEGGGFTSRSTSRMDPALRDTLLWMRFVTPLALAAKRPCMITVGCDRQARRFGTT
jgi:hypothetical protein